MRESATQRGSSTDLSFGRVVFFSAITWDHCLAGRTRRLALRMADMGVAVTVVEIPSVRAAGSRTLSGVSPADDSADIVRLAPLPGYLRLSNSFLGTWWRGYAVRSLSRQIPGLRESAVIVTTPWWAEVVCRLGRAVLCYDLMDDLRVHSGDRHFRRMALWEKQLLEQADLVTPVSERLETSLPASRRGMVKRIPNAADSGFLDFPGALPASTEPAGPRGVSVVGFVGALFEWIDQDLLCTVADRLPGVQFVFVGPTRRGVSIARLLCCPNVTIHRAQPYASVPAWMSRFDVCLIPFTRDEISLSADPIKLYEYLALGKPVVSSLRFGPAADPAPIRVAASTDEFVAAIQETLADPCHGADERRAYARRHTWTRRARVFLEALDRAARRKGGVDDD